MRYRPAVLGILLVMGIHTVSFNAQASVSEQAQRHFDRGTAAVETASSRSDFEAASREFAEATRLNPQWPDAHYNLGLVREKLGDLDGAVASLKRYLELAPGADDAAVVRSQINRIEYQLEKRDEMKVFYEILASPRHSKRLVKETNSCEKWTQNMVVSGNRVVVVNNLKNNYTYKDMREWAENEFIVHIDNKRYTYKAVHYKCTAETSRSFRTDPYCPTEYHVSGEIISFDPLTLKEEIVVSDKMIAHSNYTCSQTWVIGK